MRTKRNSQKIFLIFGLFICNLSFAQVTIDKNYRIEEAEKFANFKAEFGELTKTPNSTLDYYIFLSLDELLKSYGFLFDATKFNFLAHDLGFTDNEGKIYVS